VVPTAQLSHPAALVGAARQQAALAFNAGGNPPPVAPNNGSAAGGCGPVVPPPPAAMFATTGAPSAPPAAAAIPMVAAVAAPPVPIRNKRRKAAAGAESEARPNAVAAAAIAAAFDGNNDNHKTAPNRKATPPSSRAAATKKQKSSPSPEKPGLLLPSIASLTSGMCASAATLIQNAMDESNNCDIPPHDCDGRSSNADVGSFDDGGGGGGGGGKPTTEQKKQTSRDRNREHARCTRLRKKAYVTKLKELVDGLHAERNEDARKRRVAVQHLAEIQELRRKVVHTFLDYHSKFEGDYNKWSLILEGGDGKNDEEEFSLKQPVTPYRSFRRSEIQKVRFWLEGVIVCGFLFLAISFIVHGDLIQPVSASCL
jgi:hypothetical protein